MYIRKTVPKYQRDVWMLLSLAITTALVITHVANKVEAYSEAHKEPLTTPLATTNKEYITKTVYTHPITIEDKIKAKFGKDGDLAVKVATCESGLNPKAKNKTSSARGLFQIMQSWHKINEKWLLNPDINIEVAYKLYQESGNSFSPHWDASAHCWNSN